MRGRQTIDTIEDLFIGDKILPTKFFRHFQNISSHFCYEKLFMKRTFLTLFR